MLMIGGGGRMVTSFSILETTASSFGIDEIKGANMWVTAPGSVPQGLAAVR